MTGQALRSLHDQVILITGASSGIGLVTAQRAAAAGARVILVARNEPALAAAVRDIVRAGGTAIHAVADVGDAAQVEAAARVAIDRFGRIDTWVNDAGVAIYAMLADTPLAEHERLFRTNYFGTVIGCTTALAHMRAGAIINVGSIASDIPSPVMGAYAASKHAVKGYIESLRIELAGSGSLVSVTLVKPSGIDTPIAQHAANHMGEESLIPPVVYDPELVADAILEAAVKPMREVTVGGAGRAQVLAGTHFPRALEAFGRVLTRALTDPTRPPTATDNLFSSPDGGRVRSGVQAGRTFSVYGVLTRRRGPALLGLALVAGGCGLLLRRRAARLGGASG